MSDLDTYYNDNNAYVAEWLLNLTGSGIVTDGIVDMRPIQSVSPSDLIPFDRCHFFAGIGGWDYALKLAGWPDNRPVWTGSCPCQPFSVAGKRKGVDDERHLWPEFLRLITERRPPTIFGEQVASAYGRDWLAGVFFDLEDLGYAVAGADLCAAGVGAPHIRQRLYWVAYAGSECWRRCNAEVTGTKNGGGQRADYVQIRRSGETVLNWRLGDIAIDRNGTRRRIPQTEHGIHPLAYGVPNRASKLRAIGNSIVPQVAAAFIRAFMETEED